jgi:hypothetical protein
VYGYSHYIQETFRNIPRNLSNVEWGCDKNYCDTNSDCFEEIILQEKLLQIVKFRNK